MFCNRILLLFRASVVFEEYHAWSVSSRTTPPGPERRLSQLSFSDMAIDLLWGDKYMETR